MSDRIAEVELAKIFCRLADKRLLLDIPFAGTPELANCCHGGCDNCAFSRVFDEMNAARPKWIPMYIERSLCDGREHTSVWQSLFVDDALLDKDRFFSLLSALPCRPCMGLTSTVPVDEPISAETVDILWRRIHQSLGSTGDGLRAEELFSGLKALTGENHGAPWPSFAAALMKAN